MRKLGERKRRRCERLIGMPVRHAYVAKRGNNVRCTIEAPDVVVSQGGDFNVYQGVVELDPRMTAVVRPLHLSLIRSHTGPRVSVVTSSGGSESS
jgi:hypothetical protein